MEKYKVSCSLDITSIKLHFKTAKKDWFVYRAKWPEVLFQVQPSHKIHYKFQKISSQVHSKDKQKTIQLNITHPTKSSETLQDIVVDEAGLCGITECLVQEVVDEVDPWLDGQHHALLQVPGSAQASQPWQVNAFHPL